jgi:diguanylate cyclase (GGDEF)-like protein
MHRAPTEQLSDIFNRPGFFWFADLDASETGFFLVNVTLAALSLIVALRYFWSARHQRLGFTWGLLTLLVLLFALVQVSDALASMFWRELLEVVFFGLLIFTYYRLFTVDVQYQKQLLAAAEERRRIVEELSLTDPLTGLANRRRFDQKLANELARARRYQRPLALIAIDLDHFKLVNDQHGHPAGDEVLRQVAAALRQASRETDLPARVGGEEFALILPETELSFACLAAERLRARIANESVRCNGAILALTISVGVAGADGRSLPADAAILYRQADEALYRAKESGRNRVMGGPDSE